MKTRQTFYLMGIFLLLFCVSCSQIVKETVSPVTPRPATGEFNRVVLLPFADYTPSPSPFSYWRRNTLVLESLQDELYRIGLIPATQEDVVKYLFERGIIQDPYESTSARDILVEELQRDEYSEEMKSELAVIAYENLAAQEKRGTYGENQDLIALDNARIREVGAAFGADYVVRGRIVEFRAGEEDTFNPVKTGILPFVFKGGARTVFGVARAEKYELMQQMAIGAFLGGVLGPDDTPFDEDKEVTQSISGSPRLGTVTRTVTKNDVDGENMAFWAGAGAGAAYLAHKGGKVPDATVAVRLLVHDAETGALVWMNRAEARTVPQSAFAEHDAERLFAISIRQAVKSLVRNFTDVYVALEEARPRTAEKAELGAVGGLSDAAEAAAEAKRAAAMARESALEARKAAGEAESSAGMARDSEQKASAASARTDKALDKATSK